MIRRKPRSSRGDWHSLHKSANRDSVLRAAYAAEAILEVRRVLDDLRETDDGDRVVQRDLAVVDLLEEVHELLRTAELGVVVLDVPWREVLDPLDLHVVDDGVEQLLARRVLIAEVTSTTWFLRYLCRLSPSRMVA